MIAANIAVQVLCVSRRSACCARFSQAAAISSKYLLVRGRHCLRESNTIRRVLPVFLRFQQRRLLSPSEAATSRTGTSFFNNFVRKNCSGTNYRGADFTAASREGYVPPFSAIDYRRYAAECVRLAQSTSNPLDKARLLDMAETFSELADRNEARNPGSED